MIILEQLNEMKKNIANQLDNIDLSLVDIKTQTKLKSGINKLKINVVNGNVNLQQDIQSIINEVSSSK